MPHSISPHSSPSSEQNDNLLPDAPMALAGPSKDTDEVASSSGSSDETMQSTEEIKNTSKMDIKLEDLFNDDDEEDEEFPSSIPATNKELESSPPAAPL